MAADLWQISDCFGIIRAVTLLWGHSILKAPKVGHNEILICLLSSLASINAHSGEKVVCSV